MIRARAILSSQPEHRPQHAVTQPQPRAVTVPAPAPVPGAPAQRGVEHAEDGDAARPDPLEDQAGPGRGSAGAPGSGTATIIAFCSVW